MLFVFVKDNSPVAHLAILSNHQVLFLVQSSKEFADFWSCKTSASIVLVEIALVGVIFYVTMSCYSMDGQNTIVPFSESTVCFATFSRQETM